jgi:hypothetical protein
VSVIPAVAPYVPTYAVKTPYLTVAEFMAAPTGVDVSQLVPGGSTGDNTAALATLISSASAYADNLCFQVLAATLDIQVGEYRVFSDGTIRVPVAFTPLVEVTDVKLGNRAGQLASLTDLSGLWLQRKTVRIPVGAMSSGGLAGPAAPATEGKLFAQVSYVNGFANTALSGSPVTAGASSIVVASPLGIFPGLTLNIYDGSKSELVTVGAGYVQGSTTVPLASPLVNGHNGGVSVSALPRSIKQAVICLTSHLVKTRGAEALSFASASGGPAGSEKDSPGYTEEYEQAVDLLHPHRRTW